MKGEYSTSVVEIIDKLSKISFIFQVGFWPKMYLIRIKKHLIHEGVRAIFDDKKGKKCKVGVMSSINKQQKHS